jgi:hypothetical protein
MKVTAAIALKNSISKDIPRMKIANMTMGLNVMIIPPHTVE